MFGDKDYYPYFQELFLRLSNLTQKVDHLTKLVETSAIESQNEVTPTIEPTPAIEVIDIPAEQPTITPTTPTELLPTEDRASLLQKYKEIIARLQTQTKGSPEREQTLIEYREIKEKLARLK